MSTNLCTVIQILLQIFDNKRKCNTFYIVKECSNTIKHKIFNLFRSMGLKEIWKAISCFALKGQSHDKVCEVITLNVR
jgi:hypothetical protein